MTDDKYIWTVQCRPDIVPVTRVTEERKDAQPTLLLRKLKFSEGNGHETRHTACAIKCMMNDDKRGTWFVSRKANNKQLMKSRKINIFDAKGLRWKRNETSWRTKTRPATIVLIKSREEKKVKGGLQSATRKLWGDRNDLSLYYRGSFMVHKCQNLLTCTI